MVDLIDTYGLNAGKIWRTLDVNGSLPENKILKKINIKEQDFFSAVGWLAREGKICREETQYHLGDTNLTERIGEDAGKVWMVLDTWGEIDVHSISKLSRLDETDVFSAVGWLAREGKIEGRIVKGKKPKIKFWLK